MVSHFSVGIFLGRGLSVEWSLAMTQLLFSWVVVSWPQVFLAPGVSAL